MRNSSSRNVSLRKLVRAALPHRIERPVFILAPPRSGSTMLFEMLAALPEFVAFTRHEGEFAWLSALPYDRRASRSDVLTPSEVGLLARREVRAHLYVAATSESKTWSRAGRAVGIRRIRYLDKTISNCFRVNLLNEMFPDGKFILLLREPRANIASIIEGWPYLERFGKPDLQAMLEGTGSTLSHWTYPAPAHWEEVVHWPLAKVCAWSWVQHANAVMSAQALGEHRVTVVRYEDLVRDPGDVIRRLASFLDVRAPEPRFVAPRTSRTAVTAPDPQKWLRHRDDLERYRDVYASTARAVGYEV